MPTRNTWIATAAVAGILLAAVIGIVIASRRARGLVDTGETRASIQSSLDRLLPKAVESALDPGLISAAGRLTKEPYVASLWVVDRSGEIVFHAGGPGRQGDKVQDLAREDMAPALEALGPEALTESQKIRLLAVGAIRREGDHNDVFRHLVQALPDSAGNTAALVVLAYDVNPSVGQPSAGYIAGLLTGLAGFLVYWLGLPVWVYLDARARSEAAALWGLFVLFTNLVGLLAYLIVIHRAAPAK
jgi:hypothetical protein